MLMSHGRIASVHFRNGTTVNVAKIEGSRAYKAAVRDAIDVSRVGAYGGDDTAPQDHSHENSIAPIPQAVLGTRALRDHLPPWLGDKLATPDATQAAFQAMLHILRAAMESYLDINIHKASIALPFSDQRFHQMTHLGSIRRFGSAAAISFSTANRYLSVPYPKRQLLPGRRD